MLHLCCLMSRKCLVIKNRQMHSVGVRWKKYVLRFDNFLLATDVEKEERKRALLLSSFKENVGNSCNPIFILLLY